MSRVDVYEVVTDRIVAALEDGVVAWRKPWAAAGVPVSVATGKAYRGVNHLILSLVADLEGYESNLWGTYKAFQAQGGQVQKGQKSTPVVLWKPMTRQTEEGKEETWMLMRFYNVFNIAQTDLEVPAKYVTVREPMPIDTSVTGALHYPGGPTVLHREQDRAFYTPTTDTITLPMVGQFRSPEAYAATAFHEAVHSTGHESRLARIEPNSPFGCAGYAAEELVAEIGAAMLAAHLGAKVEYEQSAAYIASWLRVLKDDRKMIVHAAQKAQKAVDHILGSTQEVDND